MEHRVGGGQNALDARLAACGFKEQQQLGGAVRAGAREAAATAGRPHASSLRRKAPFGRDPLRLPSRPPDLTADRLNKHPRLIFFAAASGSITSTIPLLRLRRALPVG